MLNFWLQPSQWDDRLERHLAYCNSRASQKNTWIPTNLITVVSLPLQPWLGSTCAGDTMPTRGTEQVGKMWLIILEEER
jgi:hypothetical protein